MGMVSKFDREIETLFAAEQWKAARARLERERLKKPDDHWVLTQIGVTHYEEKNYVEALELFLQSLRIVGDCPLTLWNVAGALDALGNTRAALRVYTSLVNSKVSPKKDPCWESQEWSDALKADCVFRIGACFEELGQKETAEHCFAQYLALRSLGIEGIYSADEALARMQSLNANGKRTKKQKEIHKALESTLYAAGEQLGTDALSAIEASLASMK